MDEPEPALFQENERLAASRPGGALIADLGAFRTETGREIPDLRIAYETWGEFDGTNAVLICHALTGNAHAVGWWDALVGEGKPIDTVRYYVIGNNLLGGCSGSTGPASPDSDGAPWGSSFPIITIGDQTRAQAKLMEHMGVEQLYAVIGGSTGGFLALDWAVRFPERVRKVVTTASGPRQNALQLALNEAARQAVMRDPKWRGGRYPLDDPPKDGLAVARMIGHIGYLSGEALERKFGRALQDRERFEYTLGVEFAVESYLNYQANKFNERFDANSFLYMTRAANYFDLPSLNGASAEFLFVSFTSDRLYPPGMSEELLRMAEAAGLKARHVTVDLPYGHDSFLVDGERQAEAIRAFLCGD